MLHTNKDLKVQKRSYEFGEITGISLTKDFLNEKEVFLPVSVNIRDKIEMGTHKDLSIKMTEDGIMYIAESKDEDLYLILSSIYDSEYGGHGNIELLKSNKTSILISGQHIDDETDFPYIKSWKTIVAKTTDGDVFRLVWNGLREDRPPLYYAAIKGVVNIAYEPSIEVIFKASNRPLPFRFTTTKSGYRETLKSEWQPII